MPRLAPIVTVLGVNYPPEPTGISPYTGAMTRGLVTRGYRAHVITTHPHYPEWRIGRGYGQWTKRERIGGVPVARLRHYVPTRPTGVRRLLSELSFGVRSIFARWRKPSVVVTVSPALFSSALAAVRMRTIHRGVPLVVWVQDLYGLGLSETGQGSGRVGQAIRAVEGWLLRRADRVVVIHERFARRVVDDFAVAPHRVTVIRNWTHLLPAPEVDVATVRAELGWGDETVVLHAGNMGIKQGLDNVLRAARLAEDDGRSIRFVLLGKGAEHARLKEAGAAISTLQFIDPLPDDRFAQALGAADILLVNEKVGVAEMAVPSKLTSYFSTGRPVLAATDPTGITAEEVRVAEAGVIVPAGDAARLVDAVVELAGDPAAQTRLGENGRRYRETVLDETFAIDQFATLLAQLIDGDGEKQSDVRHTTSQSI